MALPFANGSGGRFIPEVWSKKLLVNFYKTTVLDAICNTDYQGEISGQGSKVNIRNTPVVGISDYDPAASTPITSYDDLSDTLVELTIDKAKIFKFKVDDVLAAQSDIPLVNEATRDAGERMKIAVDTDVLGGIYSGVAAGNIIDMGNKLDEADIAETGRWLVLPPWICSMIKKSDLQNANQSGDATSIARNGKLGIIDRFTIYQSNSVPIRGDDAAVALASDADAQYKILAGTTHYATFASQFVKTETLRLESRFGDAVRGLKVYGYKVVQPTAGVLLNAKQGV
jgi:hypothetical protein